MSRAELARLTTLSHQALALILNELVELGVVVEVSTRGAQRGPGRPALQYEYDPTRVCVVSLYIGLRYAEVSLCDGVGHPIADNVELTPGWDVDEVVSQASATISGLIASAGVGDRPCTVGVVVHGWVNEAAGSVTSDGMGWRDVPIVTLLEEAVAAEVTVLEASRAAAIAEYREGAAGGARRATVFNLGPEMTATQVIDGRPDTGASGSAGVVGRCPVPFQGEVLTIDELIGSVAARRRYNELTDEPVEWMADVYARARAGDRHAQSVVAVQIEGLAFASAWLIAAADPDRFVLTGAIGDYSEAAKATLHAAILDRLDPRLGDRCPIRFSTLARQAWIRGGVHGALEHQRSGERMATAEPVATGEPAG